MRILVGTEPPGGSSCLYPVAGELMLRGLDVKVLAAGPAAEIFRSSGIKFEEASTKGDVALFVHQYQPHAILSGVVGDVKTGLDYHLIRAAKARRLPHVAVLDAWMNYPERFADPHGGNPQAYLPDVLCVMDDQTRDELLDIGIPADGMAVTGHPVASSLRHILANHPNKPNDPPTILFVSEPIRWVESTFGTPPVGYDEFATYSLFAAAVERSGLNCRVIVKEHPRQASLTEFIKTTNLPVEISTDISPYNLLFSADIVVGMSSTLLVWAYLIGKRVLCLQPGLNRQRDCNVLTRRGVLPVLESIDQVTDALLWEGETDRETLDQLREAFGWNRQAKAAIADCVIEAAQRRFALAGATI